MTVEVPTIGERFEAELVEDPGAPLRIAVGRAKLASYGLTEVLGMGWRIVEATSEERALIESYGIAANE